MRGGMGNMQKMMKQMQKMQKDMAKAQEELAEKVVEGTAGGGMVTVKANGQKEILDVIIKEEVVDPEDIDMLQDLVLAAAETKKLSQKQTQAMSQKASFTQT